VNLIRLFFTVGIVLSCGWLYFYAHSTALFIYQVINNESYYFDIVPFYLLPYAIAPFAAALYVKGLKQESKQIKFPKKGGGKKRVFQVRMRETRTKCTEGKEKERTVVNRNERDLQAL
jgi:hypothetical protein